MYAYSPIDAAFPRAEILDPLSSVITLALAPLLVVPEHQSRRVGEALVSAGRERAAELGCGTILLVGNPSYYPQFGFVPLNRYPITLPFEAPADNCMILPLQPRALDNCTKIERDGREMRGRYPTFTMGS